MVIRVHNLGTSTKVSYRKCRRTAQPPGNAHPPLINDEKVARDLAHVHYADMIYNPQQAKTEDKYQSGINDERLTLIDLGLCYKSLHVMVIGRNQ